MNDAKDMPKVSTEHPALIQSLCWCGEDSPLVLRTCLTSFFVLLEQWTLRVFEF